MFVLENPSLSLKSIPYLVDGIITFQSMYVTVKGSDMSTPTETIKDEERVTWDDETHGSTRFCVIGLVWIVWLKKKLEKT